jgi:hypothetical protein
MTNFNNQITKPNLKDLLDEFKMNIFRSMNCVKIGEIQSFDLTKKTATIQILFKRILADNSIQSHPQLINCPVFTLQGGGGAIQMPVQKGDICLILFADRNIDIWYSTGSESAPADNRAHSLCDGIALVGLNAIGGVSKDIIPAADANVNIRIPKTKKLVITDASGTGSATVEILGTSALALFSEIQTLRNEINTFITTIFNLHKHPETGSTTGAPDITGSSPTAPVGTTKLKAS